MSDLPASVTTNVDAAPSPCRKVVLLGASNVVLTWRTIFELVRSQAGRPVEIWGAFGHGRSYGLRSNILGRGLPGITTCGLWQNLAGSAVDVEAAVVTDLGNDLMYGVDVPQIMRWVTWCVERLRERHAAIVLTRLPVASVRAMSSARFRLMRTVLFPRSQMSLTTAIRLAEELDSEIVGLATTFEIPVVESQPEWYGFDPIHVLKRHRHAAWAEILGRCLRPLEGQASPEWQPRCPRLWQLTPERRWLFGVEQTRTQPVRVLEDGTRIHLF